MHAASEQVFLARACNFSSEAWVDITDLQVGQFHRPEEHGSKASLTATNVRILQDKETESDWSPMQNRN